MHTAPRGYAQHKGRLSGPNTTEREDSAMQLITAASHRGVAITDRVSGRRVWYSWDTLHSVNVQTLEDLERPWNEHASTAEGLLKTVQPDRTLANTYQRRV